MDGRSMNMGQGDERFKFTGKELDVETGYEYFGARSFDAERGQWPCGDSYAEKYPDVSPYQYAHNIPVDRFDVDGNADFGSKEKLIEAGMKAVNNPKWEKIPSFVDKEGNQRYQTFCSSGTREILQLGGDNSFDGRDANSQYKYAQEHGVSLGLKEAQAYANMGVTVLVAWYNEGEGHVAIVSPTGTIPTDPEKIGNPLVFNVGKTNGVIGKNWAFGSRKENYFILNKDKESADVRRGGGNTVSNDNQNRWWKPFINSLFGFGKTAYQVWQEMYQR